MNIQPNWKEVEITLLEYAKTTILQFAEEHPEEVCSFFAFYAEPIEGLFRICLDTPSNARHISIRQENRLIKERQEMLSYEWSWKSASLHTDLPRLVAYSFTTQYFTYSTYTEFRFDTWLDFVDSDVYPQSSELDDGYLEGNTRIVLWKVVDTLIEQNSFAKLSLTTPSHIGYQLYDDELVTLRLLH